MYAEERQQAIATEVRARGRVAVTELAQRFEVTGETVRRDLGVLARQGVLHRVHAPRTLGAARWPWIRPAVRKGRAQLPDPPRQPRPR